MKFINLLKKELRELINAQLIIGLVMTAGILFMMGQIMGEAVETAAEKSGKLVIADQDDTDYTKQMLDALREAGYELQMVEADEPDRAALMNKLDVEGLVIIPEGFTDEVFTERKVGELERVSVVKSASMMSSLSDTSGAAVELINSFTINQLMLKTGMTEEEATQAQTPVTTKDITVVTDKSAEVNSSVLTGFLSTQGLIIPIIVFLLVIYTSQMILSAISTEKLDKTLETLLSAPVSRLSVIGAKMLAAAIVALLNATVYMVGFSGYLSSILSGAVEDGSISNTVGEAMTMDSILSQLGVSLTAGSYFLVGIQMFVTVLIALSVSMILGALVTDAKSAQTLLMPIMICAMIPYIISMTTDINTLPMVIRVIVYAIPFTHTFSAMSNVMFGNMTEFWLGFGYQCVFFVVCMIAALRIFTSDKIFTISLQFGQKKKLKKNQTANQE